MRQNLGGVAYNVTHALHLLKQASVRLLTVSGSSMSFSGNDALPSLIEEIPGESTASYVSVLDWKTNELICGFGDMGIYERQITPAFLEKYLDLFIRNQWIMFDANLSPSAMKYLVEIGRKYRKLLVFISAGGPTKARRIQPHLDQIDVLFCNRLEFEAIAESSSVVSTVKDWRRSKPNLRLICVTMGADGVLVSANGTLKNYKALTISDEGRTGDSERHRRGR